MGVNRVIEILCRRDGISYKEAAQQVKHVQEMAEHFNYDYEELEALMMEELGLEPDYIMDIIGV